jgi:hypothetical protein
VGTVGHNATLTSWGVTVAKPAGVFWIGTLIIVVARCCPGTRRYFTAAGAVRGGGRQTWP